MGADAALGGVKKAEKGRGFFVAACAGVGVTVGKCFRAQVESAKIACGNYGDGEIGKQEAPTAEGAEGADLGANPQNGKRQTGQRDLTVELAEQPGAGKRRGQFARSVEDSANHRGVGMIGDRDAVVGEHDHANRAAFERDVIDVEATVVVDRRGQLLEVGRQAAGVDLADEYLGESRLGRRSGGSVPPTLRIVDGEGGLIQIALELKTRFLDKLLIFGLA